MAVMEDRGFTQCAVDLHLNKSFIIGLAEPSDERLETLRSKYKFAKLAVDSDHDLIGREGKLPAEHASGRLQQAGLLVSSDRAAAIVLGATTNDALAALQDLIQVAYGTSLDALRQAINYISYDTTTKVQFSGPLYGLFAKEIQHLFATWQDLGSKRIVAPLDGEEWPPGTSAMVHTSKDYWEKYFGEGAPQEVLVIPRRLAFAINVPTRFYRMVQYTLSVDVESTEDFLENRYFVKSNLPHGAHIQLLGQLDRTITPGGK